MQHIRITAKYFVTDKIITDSYGHRQGDNNRAPLPNARPPARAQIFAPFLFLALRKRANASFLLLLQYEEKRRANLITHFT